MGRKDFAGSVKGKIFAGRSVFLASFFAALFLALLVGLFYNFWKYEVERICLEEGSWQGRLTGEISREELEVIESYENVEKVEINQELSQGQEITADLYFRDMSRILEDMPQIAVLAGLSPETAEYHHSLLNLYMIRDPKDPAPRLIFPLFLGITVLACVSLILIIHNAFGISMQSRIRQLGIISSVGATPGQIRGLLMREAAVLCAVPVLLGSALGVLGSRGVIWWLNAFAGEMAADRHEAVWGFHPLAFAGTLGAAAATVLVSAWLPARKLCRVTPLEAVREPAELQLKKRKKSPFLSCLFGIEGELAGNALKAQKKAFRTGTLALTFSFLAFTLMECFFTLSGISTRMTYFERYQDAWDVMVTVNNTEIENFTETDELQTMEGVRSAVVYQKADVKRILDEEELSRELTSLGGLARAPREQAQPYGDGWIVNAPLVILDDASFVQYCEQIGAEPDTDGAVVYNRIWDVENSNFRNPKYLPYMKEESDSAALCREGAQEETVEIPVLAYTQEAPLLREEYGTEDYYELVHFLPLSLWEEIKDSLGGAEADTYIRILGKENGNLEELEEIQERAESLLEGKYDIETENRIQEKLDNDRSIEGMMTILGGFCILLALIGIGNIFSNALGFVSQRKREFARYLSVGMTPGGLRKMFCAEALVIAGKPLAVTVPITVLALALMLRASYLEPAVFIREAPVFPILLFILGIFAAVALAYYLGGRKVLRRELSEMLRDDSLW
ncbi:MAG TPA: ABC transporter permease [Candidatus Choladousia intestinavium]|uniref:ABC transporter permease n=1 Tax=Candidatus Choladousia intestinavium TaxID=2840727 RepID=A0A9D1D8P0_9FIRM|nr:ABC transporter permease [Candidatus Choladousia intestinavium]